MATIISGKRAKRRKGRSDAIAGALALAQLVGSFPSAQLYLDYDEGPDVLYISLKRPQQATHTVELADQGILLDYRDKEMVGITVLDASTR